METLEKMVYGELLYNQCGIRMDEAKVLVYDSKSGRGSMIVLALGFYLPVHGMALYYIKVIEII